MIAVSNCGFFDGKPFTYDVDNCRAGGSALALTLHQSDQITVVNATVTGEGDCLVIAECAGGETCSGGETVRLRNDIFVGNPEFGGGGDTTCLAWTDMGGDLFSIDHAIINGVKGTPDPCPPDSFCGVSPGLVDESIDDFDAHLAEGSPAIDAGTTAGAPDDDFDGGPRDAQPDIGAYEQWEPTAWIYLPLTLRGSSAPPSQAPPQVAGCDVFPAGNVWNTPVDTLPVDANSTAYLATIGADAYLHPDFGSGEWPPGSGSPIGIPYVDVPGTQATISVTFTYDDESDLGPYPIPPDPPIEGGPDSDGDRHVLVLERDSCILYELYAAYPQLDGSWDAGSGAIFDLTSHALRPAGWTSADAAGLPILPGLVRYDEVAAGEIHHAIRFTAPQTRRAYVWPARHFASDLTGEQYPPMGQRFRLKADFDVSGFSTEVQVILQALKTYGMMLADNGAPWYISGVPDERWDNDVLHELHQVPGSAFEAVDVSSLMVTPDSGQVRSLSSVNDFLYQLQNLDLEAIGDTAYDLVIVDYSADGSEGGEFTAAQIDALKHSPSAGSGQAPGGGKIVLAYMSIGEAEDYRFYWQEDWEPGDPAWLDAENPDWEGNYKVRYWDPAWQTIIFSYTDRLLDAGFDGAYLDIIDAYEYYEDRGHATAAREMADFVAAIRAHARARDPDFYIFPQNAPELAEEIPAYLDSMDGIGQEDIYYGYEDEDVMTPPAVTAELETYLDLFKNAGKLVLTVDYAAAPAHMDDAYAKSQAQGYVPFVTVRDLDQLTINPGHEPN